MSTHADTASKLVLGDRNDDYGNPDEDFAGVALVWSGLLNQKLKERITSREVALMMTGLKLRREAHKHKADNLVDAHGYLLCLQWIVDGERPKPDAETHAETVEAIATGARINCAKCGRVLPCSCENQ